MDERRSRVIQDFEPVAMPQHYGGVILFHDRGPCDIPTRLEIVAAMDGDLHRAGIVHPERPPLGRDWVPPPLRPAIDRPARKADRYPEIDEFHRPVSGSMSETRLVLPTEAFLGGGKTFRRGGREIDRQMMRLAM